MRKFTEVLKTGNRYMKMWPKQAELASLFPEPRVIAATKLAMNTMPAIAVLTVMFPYMADMRHLMPQSIMMALVIFFMPLHGLHWLGQRADTKLPLSLASWYRELHQKLSEAGESVAPVVAKPRYLELAHLLKQAFTRFDQGFVFNNK